MDLSNYTYYYRLKQIDYDGSYTYSDILFVELNMPERFTLFQNYPNPFNPETIIKFQLPKQTHVTLKIYNKLGQEVITLIDENKKAGYYQVKWNGRNSQGNVVSGGLYFYQLKAGDLFQTKKLTFLR